MAGDVLMAEHRRSSLALRPLAGASFPAVEERPPRRDELEQDVTVADIRRQQRQAELLRLQASTWRSLAAADIIENLMGVGRGARAAS
jgi:hypothetical protein